VGYLFNRVAGEFVPVVNRMRATTADVLVDGLAATRQLSPDRGRRLQPQPARKSIQQSKPHNATWTGARSAARPVAGVPAEFGSVACSWQHDPDEEPVLALLIDQ
jgi:hypothetical protein